MCVLMPSSTTWKTKFHCCKIYKYSLLILEHDGTLPFAPLFIGEEKNLITPRGFSMKKKSSSSLTIGGHCERSRMPPFLRHVTMSTKELRTSRGMSPKPLMEYMLPTLSGSRLVPLPVSWGCCDDFCPGSLIPTSHKVTVTRKLQKTMDPSKIESDLTYGPRSASCVSC